MTVTPLKNLNAEPNPEVVTALETSLNMARSGELRSAAIIGDMTGNRTYTNFAATNMVQLAGALAFLLHTVCAKQRETAE